MSTVPFAAIVTTARNLAHQTAAEFDHSMIPTALNDPYGSFGPYSWLAVAANTLGADIQNYRDDVRAMAEAAKAKSYTGWSNASREPIRYA